MQQHEALGLRKRQRAQQHMIEQGKRRGDRANAKRDDKSGDDRESGRPSQHAKPVTHVLHDALEPVEPPGLARHFLNRRAVAELASCALHGLRRGHATVHAGVYLHLEVRVDLRAQILVEIPALERHPQPGPPFAHVGYRAGARTRAIASTNRSHFDVATTSCFRPAAVRR